MRSPKCEPTHINVKTYEKFATAFGGNFIEHNLESTKGRHFIKKYCQLLLAFPFSRTFYLFFKVVPQYHGEFSMSFVKKPNVWFAPFSVEGATGFLLVKLYVHRYFGCHMQRHLGVGLMTHLRE